MYINLLIPTWEIKINKSINLKKSKKNNKSSFQHNDYMTFE